jgi:triosephosphate isomerase
VNHKANHGFNHPAFRKPIIAGNWKMHGSVSQVKTLMEGICQGLESLSKGKQNSASNIPSASSMDSRSSTGLDARKDSLSSTDPDASIEIVVLPSLVHLSQVRDLLHHFASSAVNQAFNHASTPTPPIQYGAQNLHPGVQGAFTGEVSGAMLQDLGCRYVLVGHSERRSLFHEGLDEVAAKFKAAIEAGLCPILCVGETQAQREQGETEKVIRHQLESVIQFAGIEAFQQAVIAYEPVWAIGTGLTATPEQAQAVHAFIRELLAKNNVDIAKTICILYGGSMKPENAASLLTMPDIDGGLIGGASLDAKSFLAICAAAQARSEKVFLQNVKQA